MIWSADHPDALLDIATLLIVCVVLAAMYRYRSKQTTSVDRNGRLLVLIGIGIVGLHHLFDLIIRSLIWFSVPEEKVNALLRLAHGEIQWIAAFLSLLLISIGVIRLASLRHHFEASIRESERRLSDVQKSVVLTEHRFRSLIERTPGAVYCLEIIPPFSIQLSIEEQLRECEQAQITECNQAFAKEMGFDYPMAVVGQTLIQSWAMQDLAAFRKMYQSFIQNEYRLTAYELDYADTEGVRRAIQVSLTGVVENQKLIRIWGSHVNILKQQQVKAALEYRNSFQRFVAEISTMLVKMTDEQMDQELSACLQRICEFMDTDYGVIIWKDAESAEYNVPYFWSKRGRKPPSQLTFNNFRWIGPQLALGKPVRVDEFYQLPPKAEDDRDVMKRIGLDSLAAIPLTVGGETLGAIVFGSFDSDRPFTDQDVSDLGVFAQLFTNVVMRLESRKAIEAVLQQLKAAKEKLEAENVYLKDEIHSSHRFAEIVGESPQIRFCLSQVERVAATTTTVLIQGETGTGKELIARAIHAGSERAEKPLVKVNCAALPASLIESELFGHEKGAFTGATAKKRGRFDLADKGTLFLDEIGDLPYELQGKLLRVLQEGEFQRVGGTETIRVDVRLIAATNRNLQEAVDDGDFRADLYYRINVFPIRLPRLADRPGDIQLLAEHFVAKHAVQLGKEIKAISSHMLDRMNKYDWPGNVRELEAVIQREIISADSEVLNIAELHVSTLNESAKPQSEIVDLKIAEKEHIEKVLQSTGWVIGGKSGAARALGIPPSTLRSKMERLGIKRSSVE